MDWADLEQAVRAVDPCVLLVLPRILRRVIRQQCDLTTWAWRIPHRKSYVIARERLLEIVDLDELGVKADAVLPDTLILLPQPDAEKLAAMTAHEALLRYWRLLFHARIHVILQQALVTGQLTSAMVCERIYQLGTTAFDEIRTVLDQELLLLPPRDDMAVYIEFTAVFFELRYFAPSMLPRYFPALLTPIFRESADQRPAKFLDAMNLDAVSRILAREMNIDDLLHSTRPAGAPEPVDIAAVETGEDLPGATTSAEGGEQTAWSPSAPEFRRMLRRAENANRVGNTVRALIYHTQAAKYAMGETAATAKIAIRAGLEQLLQRLQRALEIPATEIHQWREPLAALVQRTQRGFWPPEAKFLYDLQKVCTDHEREIYRIHLLDWIISRGKRPLRRPLPHQREVLISKHLHTAVSRLPVVRLPANLRRQLSLRLDAALDQIEERLRDSFRPLATGALDAVGLYYGSLPERIARQKVIEELLDCVVERGYVAMGDLRDALSRNNMKLPDLSGPRDLWRGDPLLRADRQLAAALGGVYRGGEFYLRWMQRLSSVAFGTSIGRWLTRYVFVPFMGAFVALKGLEHLAHLVHHTKMGLSSTWMVLATGLFLMGLLNFPAFRRDVWQACHKIWRLGRSLVFDPLVAFFRSQIVQQILRSRAYFLASRFLARPLIVTALIYRLSPLTLIPQWESITLAASLFFTINLAINSRLGRTAEEVLVEQIVHNWHRFGWRIITGIFWALVDFFKWLMEHFERLLYTVDEWVRFRSGDTRLSLAVKATLGPIWFFVAYLTRFLVNLIIEPQINPIKHFPTVTVGHKLLLPFIPKLAGVLELTLEKGLAYTIATSVIFCIPGIFGFLVWELTGNWRLYKANRSPELTPVPIGHHGETMNRLLRPGFHSGTLPKQFARLRRADRKARVSGDWGTVRKHLHALEHLETAVHRYMERDLLAILAETPEWKPLNLVVDQIELGTNRVRVVLGCLKLDRSLTIGFDLESGWLLAGIDGADWLAELDPSQQQILTNALAGLYQMSRVDMARQRIQILIPLPDMLYRFTEKALLVSPTAACDAEVRYPLEDVENESFFVPQNGDANHPLPVLVRDQLFFSATLILWRDWCNAWNLTLNAPPPPPAVITGFPLSRE